jgi:hypothetical protein
MTPHHASTYYCKKCVKVDERVVEKKVCSHCDKELSETIKLVVVKKEVAKPTQVQIVKGGGTPDVWYGYGSGTHSEENIAYPKGHEKAGEPIPFWDKASKRDAMRLAGVKEAGDRIHGSRNEDMTPGKRKTYFT